MISFSAFDLKDVITLFDQLSKSNKHVCYLRSPDFKEVPYLSDSMLDVWGVRRETMLEQPEVFMSTLASDSLPNDLHTKTVSRFFLNSPCNKIIYPIRGTGGEIRYVEDTLTPIFDSKHELIAYAGIAKWLKENEVSSTQQVIQEFEDKQTAFIQDIHYHLDRFNLKDDYDDILTLKEQLGNSVPKQRKKRFNYQLGSTKLTHREMQIACCLVKGFTAKEIGEKLCLSYRTVENYTNQVKDKFFMPSKKALIARLMDFDEVRYFE